MSANGHLTRAELAPIIGGVPGPDPGQGCLSKEAAAAWNAMAHHIHEKTGIWIRTNGADSAYRPFSRQVYWRSYWCGRGLCGNAAVPGTSNHGIGLATDDDPTTVSLIRQYGAPFGWRIECSDAPWESWHLKWCGGWSGHDPGTGTAPVITYPTLRKGDSGEAVKRAQKHLRRWNLGLTRPAIDGDFGERTADAVREFQIVHGLDVDGRIGPNTWRVLRHKDHFLDDERSQINRIRYRRFGGITPNERPKVERGKAWCLRRAKSIEEAAAKTGWDIAHRRKRYKVLKNLGK